MALRKVGILPERCMASHTRRPRLEYKYICVVTILIQYNTIIIIIIITTTTTTTTTIIIIIIIILFYEYFFPFSLSFSNQIVLLLSLLLL
jgi:hypothetical protein